jgi:hypothetical protein
MRLEFNTGSMFHRPRRNMLPSQRPQDHFFPCFFTALEQGPQRPLKFSTVWGVTLLHFFLPVLQYSIVALLLFLECPHSYMYLITFLVHIFDCLGS